MSRLIRIGDRSERVLDVQFRLRALGLSIEDEPGHFDAGTAAAVRAFQQRRAILVDGIVGPQTWNALVEASWVLGDRVLYLKHPPMRGDDVAMLQRRLNALGFDAGREDGIFGRLAYKAVLAFQKEYGIAEDGMFGAHTHKALAGLRVDRPGTAAELREELHRRVGIKLSQAHVMIDPGHGGQDPGERGPGGSAEADLCWDISRLVAERLVGSGAQVRFTRTEPEGPEVSERALRANEEGADFFLSIHLNWHDEPTAEGASAYYFGGSRGGQALADAVQTELVKLGSRDCRSHARSYSILRETRMPAVLVEPAFISNPDEEKKLERLEFRATIADALVAGIRRYYELVPGSTGS
ncbi:MAG: N-acetylmuramoyl-L-alanine amidase, partial [Actinomycetota bacterium]|jgi:N-acetylmuramoyl-L-alanine amidase|nr:N-acetylmuramoyl-L-alanine amidase [Actinomycetota bacterium]